MLDVKKIALGLAALLMSATSLCAGFDETYQASFGDIDSDGRTDIFIRKPVDLVLLHGEITTPIAVTQPDVEELILRQTPSGNFDLLTNLSSAQKLIVSAWPESTLELVVGDLDLDGVLDVLLKRVSDFIPGAFDQIIFGPSATDPTQVSEVDTEFINYFTQTGEWLNNTDYFVDNAPSMSVTVPQTTGVGWYYYASTNSGLNNQLYNCALDHGPNCSYFIGRLDEVFSDEVCEDLFEVGIYCDVFGAHVFGYTETTVLVTVQVPDYSVFEESAVVTTESVNDALENPDCAEQSLNDIALNVGSVLGKTPDLNKENKTCSSEKGEGTKQAFVDTVAYLEYIRDTIAPGSIGQQVLVITTEPDWGRGDAWEAWIHVAKYAALQHPGAPTKHYVVRRVSQINEILMRHQNIGNIYLIGHSGPNAIFVGSDAVPDTNLSHVPGPNNVHPNTLDWSNLTEDAVIHIWGCNAGGVIAAELAQASGASVIAFTTWLNFDENTGEPFKRWFRDGQWFEFPQPNGTPISCPAGIN